MGDKHTKILTIDDGQVVASSALRANILIVEAETTVSHAALSFPEESGETVEAGGGSEVEAVGGDTLEILEYETGVTLGAYADAVVAEGES